MHNVIHEEPGTRKRKIAPLTAADRAALIEQAISASTPPPQLAALSKLGDTVLNSLIAANPNTPEKVLQSLWRTYPLQVLENPILLYWSLRKGTPLRHLLSMEVKLALYMALRKNGRLETLEEYLPVSERCDWLGAGPSSAGAAAGFASQNTSPYSVWPQSRGEHSIDARVNEICGLLATDPAEAVRVSLVDKIDSIRLSPQKYVDLQRLLAKDPSSQVRSGLASSKQLPQELYLKLSTDREPEVRRTLVCNASRQSGVCLESWLNLVAFGHVAEVAANPACPEEVKVKLVCHGSLLARQLAWRGLRFHELVGQKEILEAVENILADPERVTELVQIAKNQTIGGTLKSRLITHHDFRVTRALASQKHFTEQQRVRLFFHADARTALRSAKNSPAADYLDVAAAHPNPIVRALLVKKSGDQIWSLRLKLVDDPDPRVRRALCRGLLGGASDYSQSRALHKAVIQQYLKDPCAMVREVAARHPQFGRKQRRSPSFP